MNITVKSKIRFNGQEYSSPDQLPAEIRAAYERAITGAAGSPTALTIAPDSGVVTQLVVNGKRFSSSTEMPAAENKLYQDAMQLLRDQATIKPESSSPAPQLADTGWLTKRQVQLIAVAAGLALAMALFLASR